MATGAVGTKTGGSDGVVRWAGAALNSRLLTIDYTGEMPSSSTNDASSQVSIKASEWNNQDNKLILWPGLNHGTIMRPGESDSLVELVTEALDVKSDDDFNTWNSKAIQLAHKKRGAKKGPAEWQQFVVRVCDERGDGVEDWTINLQIKRKSKAKPESIAIDDLHPCEKDKSFRCLHINITKCGLSGLDDSKIQDIESLEMKLMMNTASDLLLYVAHGEASASKNLAKGLSELSVDLKEFLDADNGRFRLIMPYTTTYVEFRVNRNPSLDGEGNAQLCHTT